MLPHCLAAEVSSAPKPRRPSPNAARDAHASLRRYPDCRNRTDTRSSIKTAGLRYFWYPFLRLKCLKWFCHTLPQFIWSGTRNSKIRCCIHLSAMWVFHFRSKMCTFAGVLKTSSIPAFWFFSFSLVTRENNRLNSSLASSSGHIQIYSFTTLPEITWHKCCLKRKTGGKSQWTRRKWNKNRTSDQEFCPHYQRSQERQILYHKWFCKWG